MLSRELWLFRLSSFRLPITRNRADHHKTPTGPWSPPQTLRPQPLDSTRRLAQHLNPRKERPWTTEVPQKGYPRSPAWSSGHKGAVQRPWLTKKLSSGFIWPKGSSQLAQGAAGKSRKTQEYLLPKVGTTPAVQKNCAISHQENYALGKQFHIHEDDTAEPPGTSQQLPHQGRHNWLKANFNFLLLEQTISNSLECIWLLSGKCKLTTIASVTWGAAQRSNMGMYAKAEGEVEAKTKAETAEAEVPWGFCPCPCPRDKSFYVPYHVALHELDTDHPAPKPGMTNPRAFVMHPRITVHGILQLMLKQRPWPKYRPCGTSTDSSDDTPDSAKLGWRTL